MRKRGREMRSHLRRLQKNVQERGCGQTDLAEVFAQLRRVVIPRRGEGTDRGGMVGVLQENETASRNEGKKRKEWRHVECKKKTDRREDAREHTHLAEVLTQLRGVVIQEK